MVLPEERAMRYREGDALELELAAGTSHLFDDGHRYGDPITLSTG